MLENGKVVEIKSCRHCQNKFEITDKDLEFYEKVWPVFLWKKYTIPAPTLCPDCRQQRRLTFRNERKLYKRICDATGKPIISIYSPDKPYTVYSQEMWRSGNWNPLDYGRDFYFNKSFFAQFCELMSKIPRNPLVNINTINSEFNNWTINLKSCYLLTGSREDEECFYGNWIWRSKNCIDSGYLFDSQYLYDCVDCKNCFNSQFLQNCENCSESKFLKNCTSCSHCYMCINLNNKKYCIANQQYSKSDYLEKIMHFASKEGLKGKEAFFLSYPIKYYNWFWVECSTWDYLEHSKNIFCSFDISDSQDVNYSESIMHCNDIWDCSRTALVNLSYENLSAVNAQHVSFSVACWFSQDCFYSEFLKDCRDCLWCTWLRNKSYCILNKQYTKEEYEKLVPKIIEHMKKTWEWGEFFPSSISPFWYNETVAEEYFPIEINKTGLSSKINYIDRTWNAYKTLEEVGERPVFKYNSYESPFPKVDKIIPASKLPENIADIPEDILNRAIECEITKKPFRIIREELAFYRKHNLPIPRRHPDQRHLDRMKLRNPRKLFERKCDKCGKDIKTTYAPGRPEIVYCEECYNKEVC